MFNSLKSRLWLTYALLIATLLGSVSIGVLLTLRNNPLVYRQPLTQLEAVANSTASLLVNNSDPAIQKSILSNEIFKLKDRLLLIQADGSLIFDSEPQPGAQLKLPAKLIASAPGEVRFVYDIRGRGWLYTLKPVGDHLDLLVTTIKPRLPLLLILRDELFSPLVRAGLLAMLLAVVMAIILGNWIEAPLQKLARLAFAVSSGDAQPIPQEGPAEVRQLFGTFNEMVTKINVSQQSQRDFIANVSHELKTPLTSIQGFAQAILDQKLRSQAETRQSAKVILDEAQRMNKLVMGLLTLARLDSGMAESKKESLDLAVLLRNVLEKLTPQAQSAQVTLVDRIDSVPELEVDGESLTHVFVNLIDNAIKYSNKGAKVTVTCAKSDIEVEVHIIDTGIGISKQDQIRIFERFYQTDKSRRGGAKRGVGLGLAIASQYIKSMDGTLSLKSEEGVGSDFMVKLPIK